MASLKRGNGRAVPLGLRDRPPNTHARVVRRIGPEPDGGCGQPSTGRERTLAGLSLPLVPRTVSVSEDRRLAPDTPRFARGIARFAHGHVGAGGIDDRRHGRRRSRAVPTRSSSGSGMTRRLSAVEEFSLIADADVEGQQDRRGSVDRHGRGVFGERNPGVYGDRNPVEELLHVLERVDGDSATRCASRTSTTSTGARLRHRARKGTFRLFSVFLHDPEIRLLQGKPGDERFLFG